MSAVSRRGLRELHAVVGITLLCALSATAAYGTGNRLAGDVDGDGDVTTCDVFELLLCVSGPNGGEVGNGCVAAFDLDQDTDVDLADVALFQRAFLPPVRLLDLPDRYTVTETGYRVARHWMDGHPTNPGNPNWDRATCFEGLVGFYHQYALQELYDYCVFWAEYNGWAIWGGTTSRNADQQTAGQVYLELYQYDPQPNRIAMIQAAIDNMVASTASDDWWWIDAIQMALPVFAKFGDLYDDPAYFDKGWDLFYHTYALEGDQGLYSDNGAHAYGEHLWWRDAAFQPPTVSPNGQQVFWARGNGWVFAGLARTLEHMQPTDPHYADYVQVFEEMAASLVTRQLPNGFWPVNLDDPDHAKSVNATYIDDPETTGTSFFTYGLAWGVRNGFLDPDVYGPAVVAGWNALASQAVDANGRVGWCQATGIGPESSQPFDQYRTTDFGVGAVLLAASEVLQLACGPTPEPGTITEPFGTGWWALSGFADGNHDLGPNNTGSPVVVEYDVVPYNTLWLDALVGYADTSMDVTAYGSNFAMVRLYGGVFDAYDHNGYSADALLPYVPGALHHVRMEIDFTTQRYDVWVTLPGGTPVQLADDYGFRSTAGYADDVGQVTLVATSNPGDLAVYNHTVSTP